MTEDPGGNIRLLLSKTGFMKHGSRRAWRRSFRAGTIGGKYHKKNTKGIGKKGRQRKTGTGRLSMLGKLFHPRLVTTGCMEGGGQREGGQIGSTGS